MNIHCVGRSFFSLVLLCAVAVLLSACGQYGDLYLPEKPADNPPQAQPDDTQPVSPAGESGEE